MLSCRACLRHSLIPLLKPRAPAPATLAQRFRLPRYTRPYTTDTAPPPTSRDAFLDGSGHSLEQEAQGDSIADKKRQQKLRFAVRKHLEHLHDSYTIAQHVERTLRATGDSRFDETLLLVQTASREHSCTVAWNHLLDHQLKMNRLRPAIKLFNEMKKRGQKANSHTYTTIFRGCAQNPHKELAVSEAVRVYNSMSRDSNARPNIIHANAVLRVCAVAGDLDAMFAFLDKIQEEEKLRPDAKTYATILQSLRSPLADSEGLEGLSAAEKRAKIDQTISQCQEIWKEVTARSRKGDLKLDEKLVCAMGRVFLLGKVEQKKCVFALLEETMGLPRLDVSEAAVTPPEAQRAAEDSGRPKRGPSKRGPSLVKPGTDTLSLVLQAARELHHVQVGRRYWNYLVNDRGVIPDNDLWHRLLDLAHLGRSSSEAARILETMPEQAIRPNTVRTALLTCLRNTQSPNVFANARSILDVLLRVFEGRAPDVKALWFFLQVAHRRATAEKAGGETPSQAFCEQAASALEAMWPTYARAAKIVALDRIVAERKLPFESEKKIGELAQVVDVARDMVSLTSKIIEHADKRSRDGLESRASHLNRQVVVFTEMRDGKLRKERNDAAAREAADTDSSW